MLSIAAAAERLGVSGRTVYRLIDSGELESYKIRSRIVIDEKDIDRFLKAHKVPRTLFHLQERGRAVG